MKADAAELLRTTEISLWGVTVTVVVPGLFPGLGSVTGAAMTEWSVNVPTAEAVATIVTTEIRR